MAKKQSNPQELQKQNSTYWKISIGLSALPNTSTNAKKECKLNLSYKDTVTPSSATTYISKPKLPAVSKSVTTAPCKKQ